MTKVRLLIVTLLLLCTSSNTLSAQDTLAVPGADKIAAKYLSAVEDKSAAINKKIDQTNQSYISRLQREENKLYKRFARKDSTAAAKGLASSRKQYDALRQKLTATSQKITSKGQHYIPFLDSVSTSLKFLRQYGDLFKKGIASSQQLNATVSQVNTLEGKLQQADDIQSFIKERQQQLAQQLQQAGMSDALQSFKKTEFYYAAQLSDYRQAINDPDKAEKKAMALLNQVPAFQRFFKQNSFLSALFSVPDDNAATAAVLQGLQTRTQVQQLIGNQIAAGGPNAQTVVQQNIQAAQSQLNALKDKITKLGSGNSEADLPSGFAPNKQKIKTFLQRIEYGADIQTQKSGTFYPSISNLTLTAGYKLNNRSTIGLGAGYIWGWGKDIQHIAISSQGINFRSFLDVKMVKNFFASGGFEYNYQQPFSSLQQINSLSYWTKSGLIGIGKEISVKSKLFKKTRIQLLWDFLSYQQQPQKQPIIFRVGYNIN